MIQINLYKDHNLLPDSTTGLWSAGKPSSNAAWITSSSLDTVTTFKSAWEKIKLKLWSFSRFIAFSYCDLRVVFCLMGDASFGIKASKVRIEKSQKGCNDCEIVFNSFTANVADRRLGPPRLTLFKSLCLQILCNVRSILDFDTSNLGYLLSVIESKGRKK